MSIKSLPIIYIFIFSFLPVVTFASENESVKSDILFLKIQELEEEIADLRNKIESQNFLIEKLIDESLDLKEDIPQNNNVTLSTEIKFDGVEDPESIDQVYLSLIHI